MSDERARGKAPCPLCRKAERLVTYPWQNPECVIQVVECCTCTVIAPADTWDKLPRESGSDPLGEALNSGDGVYRP